MEPMNHYEPEIDLIQLFKYICRYLRKLIILSVIVGLISCGYRASKISANLATYAADLEAYNNAYSKYLTEMDNYEAAMLAYTDASSQLSALLADKSKSTDERVEKQIDALSDYAKNCKPVEPTAPTPVAPVTFSSEMLQCGKFFLVGFLIAFFVMSVFLASKFVFSDTIKSESELLTLTGSYIINNTSAALTQQKIFHVMHEYKNVQVASSLGKENCMQHLSALPDNSIVVGNPDCDLEAFRSFHPGIPVVLMEELEKTRTTELQKLLLFLRSSNTPVLACIVESQKSK